MLCKQLERTAANVENWGNNMFVVKGCFRWRSLHSTELSRPFSLIRSLMVSTMSYSFKPLLKRRKRLSKSCFPDPAVLIRSWGATSNALPLVLVVQMVGPGCAFLSVTLSDEIGLATVVTLLFNRAMLLATIHEESRKLGFGGIKLCQRLHNVGCSCARAS